MEQKLLTQEQVEELKKRGHKIEDFPSYKGNKERYPIEKVEGLLEEMWQDMEKITQKKMKKSVKDLNPLLFSQLVVWLFNHSDKKEIWKEFRFTYPCLCSYALGYKNMEQKRKLVIFMVQAHKRKLKEENFNVEESINHYVKTVFEPSIKK